MFQNYDTGVSGAGFDMKQKINAISGYSTCLSTQTAISNDSSCIEQTIDLLVIDISLRPLRNRFSKSNATVSC